MLIILHLGAVFLLFVIAMPMVIRMLLVVLLLASLSHAVMKHVLRYGPRAVAALRLDSEGELLSRFRGREQWHAATIRSRFVHRWMVLLSVQVAGWWLPTTLVLAADAVEPDVFRRLRAALLAQPRNPAA